MSVAAVVTAARIVVVVGCKMGFVRRLGKVVLEVAAADIQSIQSGMLRVVEDSCLDSQHATDHRVLLGLEEADQYCPLVAEACRMPSYQEAQGRSPAEVGNACRVRKLHGDGGNMASRRDAEAEYAWGLVVPSPGGGNKVGHTEVPDGAHACSLESPWDHASRLGWCSARAQSNRDTCPSLGECGEAEGRRLAASDCWRQLSIARSS